MSVCSPAGKLRSPAMALGRSGDAVVDPGDAIGLGDYFQAMRHAGEGLGHAANRVQIGSCGVADGRGREQVADVVIAAQLHILAAADGPAVQHERVVFEPGPERQTLPAAKGDQAQLAAADQGAGFSQERFEVPFVGNCLGMIGLGSGAGRVALRAGAGQRGGHGIVQVDDEPGASRHGAQQVELGGCVGGHRRVAVQVVGRNVEDGADARPLLVDASPGQGRVEQLELEAAEFENDRLAALYRIETVEQRRTDIAADVHRSPWAGEHFARQGCGGRLAALLPVMATAGPRSGALAICRLSRLSLLRGYRAAASAANALLRGRRR